MQARAAVTHTQCTSSSLVPVDKRTRDKNHGLAHVVLLPRPMYNSFQPVAEMCVFLFPCFNCYIVFGC